MKPPMPKGQFTLPKSGKMLPPKKLPKKPFTKKD